VQRSEVLINGVIVHVVFKDKFRRLEAILAEWLFVNVPTPQHSLTRPFLTT